MKCNQCSNQAIVQYEFGLLCVDCNLKFQQTNAIVTERMERQINFLLDEMEMVSGVRLGGGRFPERKTAIVHTGNMNFRPIVLNNSVVGNINQGTVNSLNENLQNITIMNEVYARDIKSFIESLVKEEKLNKEQKEDIANKIDFLTQQLQSHNKNKTVIKTVISSISTIVSISSGLATLWTTLSPIFLK